MSAWLWWFFGVGIALIVLLMSYHRVWPALFGAWFCTGHMGSMAFWTLDRARRYQRYSADPYARGLQGEIVFKPGILCRKESRAKKEKRR